MYPGPAEAQGQGVGRGPRVQNFFGIINVKMEFDFQKKKIKKVSKFLSYS